MRAQPKPLPTSFFPAALLAFASSLALASGDLDPAFGDGGVAHVGSGGGFGRALARDAQGNLYIAGDGSAGFSVAKFDASGLPVTSFGDGGTATVSFGDDSDDIADGVALDAAGNVYLAGTSNARRSDNNDMAVAKFDANGRLATTFGDGGHAFIDFRSGTQETAAGILARPDGLFVVGSSNSEFPPNQPNFAVAKLDYAGRLDANFGDGGKALVDADPQGPGPNRGSNYGTAIAADTRGNLYVAGVVHATAPAGFADFGVVKLTANGQLDATFGDGGKAYADLLQFDSAGAIALDAEGSVYVAGMSRAGDGASGGFGVAKFDAAGGLDARFGDSGTVLASSGAPGQAGFATAIAVDADAHVYVAGATSIAGRYRFVATALDDAGAPAAGFGDGGVRVLALSGDNDLAYAAVLDPSGALYLGGVIDVTFSRPGSPDATNDAEYAIAKLTVDRANRVFRSGFD